MKICVSLGIPLSTVEQIYKEFLFSTGNENKMDKKQFRSLYKQMYSNNQNTLSFLSDEDLNKMSDHVFHIYDFDGTGKLTFEGLLFLFSFLLVEKKSFFSQ